MKKVSGATVPPRASAPQRGAAPGKIRSGDERCGSFRSPPDDDGCAGHDRQPDAIVAVERRAPFASLSASSSRDERVLDRPFVAQASERDGHGRSATRSAPGPSRWRRCAATSRRVSMPAAISAVWARSTAWRSVSTSDSVRTRRRFIVAGSRKHADEMQRRRVSEDAAPPTECTNTIRNSRAQTMRDIGEGGRARAGASAAISAGERPTMPTQTTHHERRRAGRPAAPSA